MFFKDVMCKCPKAWSPRQEGQMDFTLQNLQILCWHVFDVIYSYEFMFFIDLALLHNNSVNFCLLLSLWTFRAKHETIRKNLITICSSDALTRASWQECWVCLRYQRPLLNLDWCQSHPITFLVWRITQRCKRWWHTCADLTFGRHSTTGVDHENCPQGVICPASYVRETDSEGVRKKTNDLLCHLCLKFWQCRTAFYSEAGGAWNITASHQAVPRTNLIQNQRFGNLGI